MIPIEIQKVLKAHAAWLRGENGGARADLSSANLHSADLRGVDLTHANLTRANLRGADLYGASLYGVDLTHANLTRASLYGADLSSANLTRASLYGADLSGANLTRASLYGADLSGANLYGANLRVADLRSANLLGVNLYGANLRGTDLRGADLHGARTDGAIGLLGLAAPVFNASPSSTAVTPKHLSNEVRDTGRWIIMKATSAPNANGKEYRGLGDYVRFTSRADAERTAGELAARFGVEFTVLNLSAIVAPPVPATEPNVVWRA